MNPGENLTLPNVQVDKPDTLSFTTILLQIVPENLFAAFSSGDVIAIMVVAIIIGIAISSMRF